MRVDFSYVLSRAEAPYTSSEIEREMDVYSKCNDENSLP